MDESYTSEAAESDDDCEVYFLKPVNEYNIIEKIKEANKELFSQEDSINLEEQADPSTLPNNRKVSFANNLEEYEPNSGINFNELKEILNQDISEEVDEKEVSCLSKTLDIIKEESSPETMNLEEDLTSNLIEFTEEVTEERLMKGEDDEILEEICEEICIMDMENDVDGKKPIKQDNNSPPPLSREESPCTNQRRMLKQITFDYSFEQPEDNESLSNLLISDNDEEPDLIVQHKESEDKPRLGDCNSPEPIEDNVGQVLLNSEEYLNPLFTESHETDDDEDDQLSIIVASYIPDDYDNIDKASLTSNQCLLNSNNNNNNSIKMTRKTYFSKRFPFSRKKKTSSSSHDIADFKLHHKICCEYKNTPKKLPKYTGYLSEYGLSREQLMEREKKLQQKKVSLLQQTLKASEEELRKMQDNERAFVRWLKNKMRFPVNKTRNMFDVKRPFGAKRIKKNVNIKSESKSITQGLL